MKFFFLLMFVFLIVHTGFCGEDQPSLQFIPSGNMWLTAFMPPSEQVFISTGVYLVSLFKTQSWVNAWGAYSLYSEAGFLPPEKRYGPGGPVDFKFQMWQQQFGLQFKKQPNSYLYFHRFCHHLLDDVGMPAVIWTTIVYGFGTYEPYAKLHTKPEDRKTKWFIGGGVTYKSGDATIWENKSPVLSEFWGKVRFKPFPISTSLFLDSEFVLHHQYCRTKPHIRTNVQNELGLQIYQQTAWRIYVGRKWFDDTVLWNKNKKNYVGLEYLF